MKNSALIHLPSGSTLSSRVLDFLKLIPDLEGVYLMGNTDISGPWEILPLPTSSLALLETIQGLWQDKNHLVYFYGDCPFLREDLFKSMWETHIKYRAQYTFADGYPYGLSTEILEMGILPSLINLVKKYPEIPLSRGTFFDILSKDINAFDLETQISPRDLRPLRLSFTLDTRRNRLLVDRYAKGSDMPLEEFLQYLEENQGPQRTLPAYFQIQTVTSNKNLGFYDPRAAFPKDFQKTAPPMSRDIFKILMDKIERFASEGVINPSLWGDPVFHPDFPGLVEEVCGRPGWSMVVETPLVGWDPAVWAKAAAVAQGKLTWIVELDCWDGAAYEKIRGEGYSEAVGAVQNLAQVFPSQVYVQTVRINETEDQMEGFYKGWKSRGLPVIIQKYDSFAGVLPDRKVNDISPLKRGVCWHLKRDMCIFIDGRVPLCKTDFRGDYPMGNALTQPLDEIWKKGEEAHNQHLKGEFSPFCRKCDEFYTYNF